MTDITPPDRDLSLRGRNARWLFFRKWVTSPLSVAAIAPSSFSLAKAMATSLPACEGMVIELGGGTGAITQALLAEGLLPQQIVIVERDPHFCEFLTRRFVGVRILQGDACSLKSLLAGANIPTPVRAVISGLPFLAMSPRSQARLLHQTFAITDGKGPFIQFSYSPRSPLKKSVRDHMGITESCHRQVWRNLPPAKVWCFQGAGKTRSRHRRIHHLGCRASHSRSELLLDLGKKGVCFPGTLLGGCVLRRTFF